MNQWLNAARNRVNMWLALVVGLCALALVITAGAPAAAAPPSGTPGALGQGNGQGNGQGGDQALQNFYQREQRALGQLQHRIGIAQQMAAKAQDWITALQGKGRDASALQAGLVVLDNHITDAQNAYDQAAGLLSAHAGFDANGSIMDRQQAHDTVKSIRDALISGHLALVSAVKDFRLTVNQVRQANHATEASGGSEGGQGNGQGGQGNGQGNGQGHQGGPDQGTETPEPTETESSS